MIEACFETPISFWEFFLLYPLGSSLALIALGALLLGMWIRLKGWWRLLPILMVLALVAIAAVEPIKLQNKIAAAQELLAGGNWRENASFELRGASEKITAYRVDLGSKCNAGFLVEVESSMHTDTWGFTGGYPNSPEEHRFENLQGLISHSDNSCTNRAEVMYGERWREVHPEACANRLPKMAFLAPRPPDPLRSERVREWPGFEMQWCRRLDDRVAYCEAGGIGVALASGVQF
jgi:hypothetical protein